MRRLLVLMILPLLLFALERVNLIRNSGFEKDDSSWVVESGSWGYPNPAIGLAQDSLRKVNGNYSASADTREIPLWKMLNARDSACVHQHFLVTKKKSDLDSLIWSHAIVPLELNPTLTGACLVGLTFSSPERDGFCYGFFTPFGDDIEGWVDISEHITDDTTWKQYKKSITQDFTMISPDQELASLVLNSQGVWVDLSTWWSQKCYWDDIRLMGYADYDVGIKAILSSDSTSSVYTPTARIKNFGRKAADTFLVIAEIKNGVNIVYSDTMPYSLPADTEDTLSFKVFTPPQDINYTLTVRTEMTPDESDEDDEMSKTLYGSGIGETPTFTNLQLDVARNTPSSLLVYYSIPTSERGTLTLYDPSGCRIESYRVQGEGQVAIKASLSSGVYFVKLEAGKTSVTKKAVVLQ